MKRLRVSRAAHRDLVEIAVFTRERWGDAQCARYLRQLDARFNAVARAPERGRSCDQIRPGLKKVNEGRHVIFYRSKGRTVDIVRVLHDSMDPDLHL
jgi:toxin ParE1/3/4